MRDDAREIIKRTLQEVSCGARTLDPVTEIDIALTAAGMQIVKFTKKEPQPFVFDDED